MKAGKLGLAAMLTLALLATAGCGWVENLQVFKSNDEVQPPGAEDEGAVVEQGLDIVSNEAAGQEGAVPEAEGAAPENTAAEGGSQPPAEAGESREVVLYFASADGGSLEAETRAIPKQEGIARATVNQLIAGPQQAHLTPTLPANTILEDIDISNGLCTVDFSTDLVTDLSSDTQSQLLALYSIVNTLSQFDSVDYVRILVDGKTVDAGVGGVDVSAALAPAMF